MTISARRWLAQTELPSGYPLDTTSGGSWQRLNLAAAMSATVQKNTDGSVTVTATGGTPTVIEPAGSGSGPSTVAPGTPATFVFRGYQPGETVEFTLQGENASGASLALVRAAVDTKTTRVTAGSDGTAKATVTLPASARGSYTLRAVGLSSGTTGSVTFSVALPATASMPRARRPCGSAAGSSPSAASPRSRSRHAVGPGQRAAERPGRAAEAPAARPAPTLRA